MKFTLVVKDSEIHGKGLFTTRAIQRGTVLGWCKTKKTTRQNEYTLWIHDGNTPVDVTCRFRFINHHKDANVAYCDDYSVEALCDIPANTELFHDYGEEWD